MTRLSIAALAVSVASAATATEARAQQPDYLRDFAFVRDTVAERSIALRRRGLDWQRICAGMRPAFEAARTDVEHVRNVMRLLATLGDSQTAVARSDLDDELKGQLPSKWDGLYGGGLWLAWEDGRVMLRGIMDEHPLEGALPLGAALIAVENLPTWLVLMREKSRITRYHGSSSDHSLFASMGNRLFPFGDRQEIAVTFLTADGKKKRVGLRRWGPGGKSFRPLGAQLPERVSDQKGAVSAVFEKPWSKNVGYVKITGRMDPETVGAFDEAFGAMLGVDAGLLDCRGIGGDRDAPARAMCGRFFSKAVPFGDGGALEPSGPWQFDGPAVMLQDESVVSSAEALVWTMSETGRVVSVGRRTAGWALVPRRFECPSGIVSFRLAFVDRATPIGGVHTEGDGWPPDIEIPYGPRFCAMRDPALEVGMKVLHVLHAGVDRDRVVALFRGLFDGDAAGFEAQVLRLRKKVRGFRPKRFAKLVDDDLEATLAMEIAMLDDDVPCPDVLGSLRRFEALAARAKRAQKAGMLERWSAALAARRSEAEAQQAFAELVDAEFRVAPADRKRFVEAHGGTRTGRWLREELWK